MSPDKQPKSFVYQDEYSDAEIAELLKPKSFGNYAAAEWADPMEMYLAISRAPKTPHLWQINVNKILARKDHSKAKPLRLLVRAANGSGKDALVIALFAIFFIWTNIRSKCIITSGSWLQLDTQTEANIVSFCNEVNETLGRKIFTCKKMFIICNDTGSVIKLFSTDEPGRAEGHHPFADYPESKVAVIVNEAKTVPDEIIFALMRCSYSIWLEISSPGTTAGHFYTSCRKALPLSKYGKLPDYNGFYELHVTSYDCSHIAPETIDFDKREMGENHPVFRSKHLAEFTSQDEQVVIPKEALDKCLALATLEYPTAEGRTAGLDLAVGGDECTFYVFEGNKFIGREVFKSSDPWLTVKLCTENFFPKYGFKPKDAYRIKADHGGIGRAFAGHFADKGWELSWIENQGKPIRGDKYVNRGAELYFNFFTLVQQCIPILPKDDQKLLDQLSSRYYRQTSQGKLALESKKEARLKGHGSPDRADAVVLAFSGITRSDFDGAAPAKESPAGKKLSFQKLSNEESEALVETRRYSNYDNILQQKSMFAGGNSVNLLRKLCHGKR